jgi:exosortase/archaeosortase family protein
LEWITASINNGAGFITSFFGVNAIVDRKEIFVENSASVMLEYSCLGMGIMSFWIAFIVAHKISISNKLLWIVGGILLIWVINCWRIAILLISLQNRWKGVGYMDHHDMFNLASYAIIGLLLYFFYRKSKEEELTVSAVSL